MAWYSTNYYQSRATAADLVDDCLCYTFDNLSFKENVGVMRVCQRWRKVLTDYLKEKQNSLEFELERPLFKDESQPLNDLFPKQAVVFETFHFVNIEKVTIQRPSNMCHRDSPLLKPFHLQWLFNRLPKLKCLCLFGVGIDGDSDQPNNPWTRLDNVSPRLTSLVLSGLHWHWDVWLAYLMTRSTQLKELTLKKHEWELFLASMASDRVNLRNNSTLSEVCLENVSLEVFFWFAGNKPFRRIRLRSLLLFSPFVLATNLALFGVFSHLKALSIDISKEIFGEFEFVHVDFVAADTLPTTKLNSLRYFKLSRAVLRHAVFLQVLNLMPSLTFLKLRNCNVFCSCDAQNNGVFGSERCEVCPVFFIEHIAALENLKKFHFKNDSDTNAQLFTQTLIELINTDRIVKVRKLMLSFGDYFNKALFDAFIGLARKSPGERFEFWAPFKKQANKNELLQRKTRNLYAFTVKSRL